MSLSIIQIAFLAIITMLVAVLLKKYQPEGSLILCIAIGIIILIFVVQAFDEILLYFTSLSSTLNLVYVGVLIKLLGIAYICEFASGLCKDAGYQSIAGQVEIAGRVAMVVISLPILRAIIETINGMLA